MANNHWFQLLKYDNMQLFSVLCNCIVRRTKIAIKRCHLKVWEVVMGILALFSDDLWMMKMIR